MHRRSSLKLATIAIVAGALIPSACSENSSLPTELKAPPNISAIGTSNTVFDFSGMAGSPDRGLGTSFTFTDPVAGSIVASAEQTRLSPGIVQVYAKGTGLPAGDAEKGLGFCVQGAGPGDQCTTNAEYEIGDNDDRGRFPSVLLNFTGLSAGTVVTSVTLSSLQSLEAYKVSSSIDGSVFTPFASGLGDDAQQVVTIPVNDPNIKYLRFEVGNGGAANNYLVAAATTATTPPPEETPCPAGSFTSTYDATGLHIKYDQFPAPNDNSYGVNAVGWKKRGHTFKDLVNSDHAGFQLRDANGVVRLSFNVDYLTADASAPSGYASLGVDGGDGEMIVGTSDGITATTSLANNLNNINIPGLFSPSHTQQFGSVDVLVNSPPTDPAHTTYDISDPTLAGWDFHDTYYVNISAAKLASLGFNPATWTVEPNVDQLHNSPPKACPAGSDAGAVAATKYDVKDKEVKITIENTGNSDVFLEALTLNWPASNGKLKEIQLDRDVVYKTATAAGPISLTTAQLTPDPKKRRIEKGKSDVYTLVFDKKADRDLADYSGTVTFSGTTLTILPH